MSRPKFADLHCHPAVRPWLNGANTIWEAYSYTGKKNKMVKVIEAQRLGKRGAMYDQAGFPKLHAGGTRIVFAAMYPMEKGFLLKNHFIGDDSGPVSGNKKVVNENRTILLSLFTKYPFKRLVKMSQEEYWDSFLEEYRKYLAESGNVNSPYGKGSAKEIEILMNEPVFKLNGLLSFDPKGTYVLADKINPPASILKKQVMTILTMEGMGILTQTAHANGQFNPPKVRSQGAIFKKIKFIKEKTPVFFITFCHHFDNGVCGHARSIPCKSKILGLNQEKRINKGFNKKGFNALQALLSVEKDSGGVWRRRKGFGRRIYIDMKHMSLAGRKTLIKLVKNYNANNPDNIPLIASHSGYTGLSIAGLAKGIKPKARKSVRERDKTQVYTRKSPHFTRPVRYNKWSINLASEEIVAIVESDGLIGLSLEQNILGVGFSDKMKKATQADYTHLIVSHLCMMAKASGSSGFWKHIAIGSDFDGLINPVDGYPASLFFVRMRLDILDMFNKLTDAARDDFFLPSIAEGKRAIVSVIDDFCFNNAERFVLKYFNHEKMPDVKAVFRQVFSV